MSSELKIFSIKSIKPTKSTFKEISALHVNSFKGFFLSFMGKGFLKVLYKGYYKHDNSDIIIAEENGKVVGFLAYSNDSSNFYRFLIKRKLISCGFFAFLAFLRKPSIFKRLFRAFKRPEAVKSNDSFVHLMSIAVSTDCKSKGIGSKLIDKLKEGFSSEKFAYIKLETDADDNDKVNAFYIKNGFTLDNLYVTPEGRRLNEYKWSPNTNCQVKNLEA